MQGKLQFKMKTGLKNDLYLNSVEYAKNLPQKMTK